MGRMVELARLGRLSRARITHMMDLLMLAPEIQEEILMAVLPGGGVGAARTPARSGTSVPITTRK